MCKRKLLQQKDIALMKTAKKNNSGIGLTESANFFKGLAYIK